MWHEIYDPDELSVRQFGRDPSKQERFRDYLSMVSLLDDHVRKIVEKLESMGVADNTLVVFTSDHGDHFGWIGRNGHKQSPEDVSVRVPLLMHWPNGLGQFGKSELIVGALDLMPTILGLLDLPVPETCVGRNLSNAILKGDDDAVDSAPLFLFGPAWRGVYTREFTYSTQNYDYATEANRVVGGIWAPKVTTPCTTDCKTPGARPTCMMTRRIRKCRRTCTRGRSSGSPTSATPSSITARWWIC